MIVVDKTPACLNNYLYTYPLELNISDLVNSCERLKTLVHEKYKHLGGNKLQEKHKAANLTTKAFAEYNTFLYPFPEFHALFCEIQKTFRAVNDYDGTFYLQSWLNYYEEGQHLYPHVHWPSGSRAWHGYYCVSVGSSKTVYEFDGVEEQYAIVSQDNMLVIGRSETDKHCTEPWADASKPRITIAFDIVPADVLETQPFVALNHWIPI